MTRQAIPASPQPKTAEESDEITGLEEMSSPVSDDNTAPGGAERPFPIVGIGASAGGLEALEVFLKNVPPSCGMAFVIVQHPQPPTHKGIMVELLQRRHSDTGNSGHGSPKS